MNMKLLTNQYDFPLYNLKSYFMFKPIIIAIYHYQCKAKDTDSQATPTTRTPLISPHIVRTLPNKNQSSYQSLNVQNNYGTTKKHKKVHLE